MSLSAFSIDADRKIGILKDAKRIVNRAARSIDALRRDREALRELASQLQSMGCADDAARLRAIADELFRESGAIEGDAFRLDRDRSGGAYRDAYGAIEDRITQIENDLGEILEGRRARYNPETGVLEQPHIPGYWELAHDVLYGRPARYNPETGVLVVTPTRGLYSSSAQEHNAPVPATESRLHWIVPAVLATLAVVIAFVLGAWFNGATYAGWIIGVGFGLTAVLMFFMNIPYFTRRNHRS